MKKFISLFLAVIMAFSFMVPAFAAETAETTTAVVEEESGLTVKEVFKSIWETIKKCFPSFKNIIKNFIAFIDSLFEADEPEEPTTEAPTTEEPTTEEPTTEETTTEEPTTEEPTTEAPTTEEQTTEEPATEESTVDNTVATLIIEIIDFDDIVVDTLTVSVPDKTELVHSSLFLLIKDEGYIPTSGIAVVGDETIAQAGETYYIKAYL